MSSFISKLGQFFVSVGREIAISLFQYEPRPNERYVEYPFVLRNLDLTKGKILDVGCVGSFFPLILVALGYEVYGIDVRQYPMKNPNFKFVAGDIRHTSFPKNYFDRITAVSTIEHVGLSQRYGSDEDPTGDRKAVEEMTRILKPNGKILMTIPYAGEAQIFRPFHRVYDRTALRQLL